MNILVATDFTPRSQRAVRRAGILAGQHGGKLVLMHVIDGPDPHEVVPDLREAQRMIVEQIAVVPELHGISCEPLVVGGCPPDAILDAAAAHEADLVVVGAALKATARHSERTVRSLIRKAPCPVLVVRQPAAGPYRRVVVPVDFSDASARALQTVASLKPLNGTHVTVVHAFEALGKPKLSGFGVAREHIDSYVENWRSSFAEEVETFLGADGLADRDWSRRVEEGPPDKVIVRLTARMPSTLVVMGTHARTGIRKAFLGSVTEDVLIARGADVLVVPPLRSGVSPGWESSAHTVADRVERPALRAVTA